MLDLSEALDIVDSGQWFSICYVSYDAKRKKAGDIIRIRRCQLLQGSGDAGRTATDGNKVGKDSRNPNHYQHATRNLRLANNEIRKVHIRLIFAINGIKLL